MTTAAERQSRRRTKLNQIAQDAGFTSWTKYETSIIQEGKIEMNEKTYSEKAERRVLNSPSLCEHADTILYDWPEGDSHWKWVATAPIKEILDWVKTVEKE